MHALRDEYTRTIEPASAIAAEALTVERTLSDLVNQAYALAPAEIALMWQTAPARVPMLRQRARNLSRAERPSASVRCKPA